MQVSRLGPPMPCPVPLIKHNEPLAVPPVDGAPLSSGPRHLRMLRLDAMSRTSGQLSLPPEVRSGARRVLGAPRTCAITAHFSALLVRLLPLLEYEPHQGRETICLVLCGIPTFSNASAMTGENWGV